MSEKPSRKPISGEFGVQIPDATQLILQVRRDIALAFPGDFFV
jgi:hypothetical protein